MLKLQLDNKNGTMWDLSEVVTSVKWKTTRIGKASSLGFTYIKGGVFESSEFVINNGDIVRCIVDDANMFYGYVFSVETGKDEDVSVTCYDQTRYLMNTDTYVLANVTATDVLKRIASDFGLKTGTLADTGYVIPTLSEDGQKLMDIICKSLTLTLINTGRNYVLFDDFGELTIRNIESTLADFYIGTGSLLTDYSYKQSIDDDTYNRIKLYKENKESGKREVHIAQDSNNIAKWGLLQLYQSVDEDMNDAQIRELLDQFAVLKNKESKTLKIEAIGNVQLRAGSYISLVIPELDINQPFLIDECSHDFKGSSDHTMSLELKVI